MEYAEQAGADGMRLLASVFAAGASDWLRRVPAVEVLRRTWVEQFRIAEEDRVRMRPPGEAPPASLRPATPYAPQARRSYKRGTEWTGYKVHLTETCDAERRHLVTHVITNEATGQDADATDLVHDRLAELGLTPAEHFVDEAFVSADVLTSAARDHGIDLAFPSGASRSARPTARPARTGTAAPAPRTAAS